MRRRAAVLALSAATILAVTAATGAVLNAALPAASGAPLSVLEPIAADEHARTISAMRPPKRTRPVVAIIGQNEGTETTDFLIPFGVLTRSGLADVVAVAPESHPVRLTPALMIEPQATTAEFDTRYPDGADYVIVPKIEDTDHPAVVAWIQDQSTKGAIIVGICAGTKTLSAAGLFAGRSATGHWYDIDDLRKSNPSMTWVQDRRYVVDGNVVTTTGVSASVPISLALVEAIGGHAAAESLARELGAENWDARHDSGAFYLNRDHFWTSLGNKAVFWDKDVIGVPVQDGVDEISLGLTADAYSRTDRSQAKTIAESLAPVATRSGLRLLPDLTVGEGQPDLVLPPSSGETPIIALDTSLEGIAGRYGPETAGFVALQLEYAWRTNED